MIPSELEPAIPVGERTQTHILDRAATGIGASHNLEYMSWSPKKYRQHEEHGQCL